MTFLEKYASKKILDGLYSQIKKRLRQRNYQLITKIEDVQESLNRHFDYQKNWSRIISFRDMIKEKHTNSLYVELDIKISPKKWSAKDVQNEKKI